MQVVFVHGVNTRDDGAGPYADTVRSRDDRMRRLAFGEGAQIHNPYWGRFGLPGRRLASFPARRGGSQPLGARAASQSDEEFIETAKKDFAALIGSLSVVAIGAGASKGEAERRAVEDYWLAAAAYAEARGTPSWLKSIGSKAELLSRLDAEVEASLSRRSLGAGWARGLRQLDLDNFFADRARSVAEGFLSQFLGDALMLFARREKGIAAREEVARHVVVAAKAAAGGGGPLVLVGHSMGGALLHDLLTDERQLGAVEEQLGHPLTIDLFLGVGTQIGLFAELGLFSTRSGSASPLMPVRSYWNVYDHTDTLAYLCEPSVPSAVDFEVATAGGIFGSHGAYFENALFFDRLARRLKSAGLVS